MSKEIIIPGYDGSFECSNKTNIGAWLFDNGWFYSECSVCGKTNYNQPSRFCPECGAMMLNYEPSLGYYRELMKKIPVKGTEEQKND